MWKIKFLAKKAFLQTLQMSEFIWNIEENFFIKNDILLYFNSFYANDTN